MKTLSFYLNDKQTKLFDETGAFFAFSQEQFDKSKKEDVEYVSLNGGLVCPKDNVADLLNGMKSTYAEAIQEDIAENGIDKIIRRELINHEAGYTMDIEQTFDSLRAYGVTEEQVQKTFNSMDWSDD